MNYSGKEDIQKILEKTNVKQLLDLSKKLEKEHKANKAEALKLAKEKGWIIRKELKNGQLIELIGVNEYGKPIYYITENLNAAKTTSTDKLWTGGSLGLNLTGSGMTAGEWDGGDVLLTHQEFGGRVTDQDGTGATSEHSTHVAGTIMASGVDGDAKGMSYEANLDAYEWNNDESEMAAAAAGGLLISNHSNGYSTGWTWDGSSWSWSGNSGIDPNEDYYFGFYDSYAQIWDQIALNAPYYLIGIGV